MRCIRVTNVNKALPDGLKWLSGFNGEREDSRNGPVLVSNMPVTTIYDDITHRVLFSPMRNANPFFHVMESLWMLAGRNELPLITQFNKQMAAYSDDGGLTQPAAYGHRWREYFGYDQIRLIVDELRQNPTSRRCVLAMWNAGGDRDNDILVGVSDLVAAINGSADVPCNTHCYFRIHNGVLDMMVSCRSNDIYWGAYGANVVHFSMLQEYMAAHIGVPAGKLTQVSWNYHLYVDVVGDENRMKELIIDCEGSDYYSSRVLRPMPLVQNPVAFDEELPHFMALLEADGPSNNVFTEPFLGFVALPMLRAWREFKAGDLDAAELAARRIQADDWRLASVAWMERRAIDRHRKEAGL